MKLFKSSTFLFGLFILLVAALAAGFTDDLTWKDWLVEAKYMLGIYATKEGVKYGSEAIKSNNA